ncbi:MAG: acetate kinase, partial [bacterium]
EEAENQDRRARLAIDIFCSRVRKYIGAYFAEMEGADAVIFTGGIGQNAPDIRRRICSGLECLGLELESKQNKKMHSNASGVISTASSKLKAFVIPTNEELLIARDTVRVITDVPRRW